MKQDDSIKKSNNLKSASTTSSNSSMSLANNKNNGNSNDTSNNTNTNVTKEKNGQVKSSNTSNMDQSLNNEYEKQMVGGCCVCADDTGYIDNALVYCDGPGCQVAVHQACYGIFSVPEGNWFCRSCEHKENNSNETHLDICCRFCPSKEGALKRTDDGKWAHVICALYIPEITFGNLRTMEPIITKEIFQERYNKKCLLCELNESENSDLSENSSNVSNTNNVYVKCSAKGCVHWFHVTCAQSNGLLCEDHSQFKTKNNVLYCIYCKNHFSKLQPNSDIKRIPAFKISLPEPNTIFDTSQTLSKPTTLPNNEKEAKKTKTTKDLKRKSVPIKEENFDPKLSSNGDFSTTTNNIDKKKSRLSNPVIKLETSLNENNNNFNKKAKVSNNRSSKLNIGLNETQANQEPATDENKSKTKQNNATTTTNNSTTTTNNNKKSKDAEKLIKNNKDSDTTLNNSKDIIVKSEKVTKSKSEKKREDEESSLTNKKQDKEVINKNITNLTNVSVNLNKIETKLTLQQQQSDSGVSSMTSPSDSLNESCNSILSANQKSSTTLNANRLSTNNTQTIDKSLKRKLRNNYNDLSSSSSTSSNNDDPSLLSISISKNTPNIQLKSPNQKRLKKNEPLSVTTTTALTPPPSVLHNEQNQQTNNCNQSLKNEKPNNFGNQLNCSNSLIKTSCTESNGKNSGSTITENDETQNIEFKLPNNVNKPDGLINETLKSLIGFPKQTPGSSKKNNNDIKLNSFQTNTVNLNIDKEDNNNNSYPNNLEELLMKQWDLGADLVMEHVQKDFDIINLLKILSGCKKENDELRKTVDELEKKYEYLKNLNGKMESMSNNTEINSCVSERKSNNNNNNIESQKQQSIAQPTPTKLQPSITTTPSVTPTKKSQQHTMLISASPISSTSSSPNSSSFNRYSSLNQTSPAIANLMNNSTTLNSYFQNLNSPNGIQTIKNYINAATANYLPPSAHLSSALTDNASPSAFSFKSNHPVKPSTSTASLSGMQLNIQQTHQSSIPSTSISAPPPPPSTTLQHQSSSSVINQSNDPILSKAANLINSFTSNNSNNQNTAALLQQYHQLAYYQMINNMHHIDSSNGMPLTTIPHLNNSVNDK